MHLKLKPVEYNGKAKGVSTLPTITDAISHASFNIAHDLKAGAIITPTASGYTAKMVSKYRPKHLLLQQLLLLR